MKRRKIACLGCYATLRTAEDVSTREGGVFNSGPCGGTARLLGVGGRPRRSAASSPSAESSSPEGVKQEWRESTSSGDLRCELGCKHNPPLLNARWGVHGQTALWVGGRCARGRISSIVFFLSPSSSILDATSWIQRRLRILREQCRMRDTSKDDGTVLKESREQARNVPEVQGQGGTRQSRGGTQQPLSSIPHFSNPPDPPQSSSQGNAALADSPGPMPKAAGGIIPPRRNAQQPNSTKAKPSSLAGFAARLR
ncbi:hypothetical protein DL95DRAFT_409147 [Leptodontidium sp. 2 PMI_412]|nr:hypothetical protein DL95DRAFT_409147 [Leptodontidium sp. 2 PMI_412]